MINIFPPPAMKFPTPPHGPSVDLVMTRAPPRWENPKNVFFSFAQDNRGDFYCFLYDIVLESCRGQIFLVGDV